MSTKYFATGGLIALAAGLAMTGAATTLQSHGATRSALDGFQYQGDPIHPMLVEEFEGWLADDGPPVTVTVDVAAAFGTNEYSEPVETNAAGLVQYSSGAGWYGYQHVGQMSDGTHVLRTASNGGGSGIFMTLLFVRLEEDEVRDPTGLRHARVLMTVSGRFALGDRDDGTVRVDGDRVVVGASRYRAFSTVLDFGR